MKIFFIFLFSEKCSNFGSDLCFQTKVKEIVVKIGSVGTNDDVTVTFCSDVDTTQVVTNFTNYRNYQRKRNH